MSESPPVTPSPAGAGSLAVLLPGTGCQERLRAAQQSTARRSLTRSGTKRDQFSRTADVTSPARRGWRWAGLPRCRRPGKGGGETRAVRCRFGAQIVGRLWSRLMRCSFLRDDRMSSWHEHGDRPFCVPWTPLNPWRSVEARFGTRSDLSIGDAS